MALINCPECGKEISDTCENCIHCGYKLIKTIDIEEVQTKKKKFLSKPIIIIVVSVIVLLIIVLFVNKSLHTYSYEEKASYNATYYFCNLWDSDDDYEIKSISIAPITDSPPWKSKHSYIKHFRDYIVAISYVENNPSGTKKQDVYYIKAVCKDILRSPSSEEIQKYYLDGTQTKINLRKINYAIEHPELMEE